MRVALDAFGGDSAPEVEVEGALRASEELDDCEIVLVGHEQRLREVAARHGGLPPSVSICHASQAVGMDDSPVEAIRRKPDSSIAKAIELMGGSPTTMSSGELYLALQRKTIDGCTRPLITGLGRKLYEVVDNISVTNMAYFTCMLAINKEKWDSLPKDIQAIITKAAKNRDKRQLEMLEAFMTDAIKKYQEKGVNVHMATAEELARRRGTIPYEVTCAIGPRVRRVYVETEGVA